MRSCLDGSLLLGETVDRSLIDHVHDTSDGSSSSKAVHQVGVDVVGGACRLSKRFGIVVGNVLGGFFVDTFPFELGIR